MKQKTATFLSIFILIGVFVLGPAVLVYIVDPFQIYHKSFFKKAQYSWNQSFQHAGWINRLLANPAENYQAIIIGSSTMANYTQTLINAYLPWGNTMNLSVDGSSPWMQHAIAKYALEQAPQIKHILWDVHFYYVFPADDHSPKTESNTALHFPTYLYNNNILDDKPYLFNETNVETSLRFLAGDFTGFDGGVENNGPFYEGLRDAGRFTYNASLENMKNNLLPMMHDLHYQLPDKTFYKDKKFSSLDLYMLDILMPFCNTDKDIIIMFSPSERYIFTTITDSNFLYQQILMRRYLVDKTSGCKNIRIFAFDNEDWIVNNLGNYADSIHYTIEVNNYIVESIAKNRNLLTKDNIDQYESQLINNINNYRSIFLDQIQKLSQENNIPGK